MDPTDPVQEQEYNYKVLKELTTDDEIKEFNKRAKSGNGNTFIIYFAHWCPHCQALTPELIKLDEFLLKNKTKLVGNVARISDEHIDQLDVFKMPNGFPTIVILDGNGDKTKDYNGKRTMEGFLKFLEENAIYNEQKGGSRKSKKSRKLQKSKKMRKSQKSQKSQKSKKSQKNKKLNSLN
jgi:thiol-disulfide isomerase/thioredoxin